MSAGRRSKRAIRSDGDLAKLVTRIATAAGAKVIICVTDNGSLARETAGLPRPKRVIAATANPETFESLQKDGMETILLALRAVDKYRQVRHVFSVALKAGRIAAGETVVCVFGHDVYRGEGELVVLTDIEPALEELAITDLLRLTDGIRPQALEAALALACRIGRAARRGKRLGTILMLGDPQHVLEGSRQLIPNPLQGHEEAACRITNLENHGALVELAKLDGAFVAGGDGLIRTAGVFLASPHAEVEVPPGLGARHIAAAAATVRTRATAIVVSATDGHVRIFAEGKMVLQLDPDVEFGPIHEREGTE